MWLAVYAMMLHASSEQLVAEQELIIAREHRKAVAEAKVAEPTQESFIPPSAQGELQSQRLPGTIDSCSTEPVTP